MGEEKLDRRQRRSKTAFREALAEILNEKDLSHVTVKELAERADRDRKTFYLHYDSIESLVDEILEEEIERVVKEVSAVSFGDNLDVPKLFAVFSKELVAGFSEKAFIVKHTEIDKIMQITQPIFIREIVENDSLGLAKTLGPYLEPMVSYFCGGLLSLYHQWATSDSQVPLEQLAELAGATLTGGIAALTAKAKSAGVN